jgi:hypothetical protein
LGVTKEFRALILGSRSISSEQGSNRTQKILSNSVRYVNRPNMNITIQLDFYNLYQYLKVPGRISQWTLLKVYQNLNLMILY